MQLFRRSLLALPCLALFPLQLVAQIHPRALERPVANPVVPSPEFRRAVERETRTTRGVPGPEYWQQSAHYTISARLDVDEKRLEGSTRILYRNASPDSLRRLVVQLIQNFHRYDEPRTIPAGTYRPVKTLVMCFGNTGAFFRALEAVQE